MLDVQCTPVTKIQKINTGTLKVVTCEIWKLGLNFGKLQAKGHLELLDNQFSKIAISATHFERPV